MIDTDSTHPVLNLQLTLQAPSRGRKRVPRVSPHTACERCRKFRRRCDSGMPCEGCKLSDSSCKKIGPSKVARHLAKKLQLDDHGNLYGTLMRLPREVLIQKFSKGDLTETGPVSCRSFGSAVSAIGDKATSTQGNDPPSSSSSSSSSSLFTGHTSQQGIRNHPGSFLSGGGLSSAQPFSAHIATVTSTPSFPCSDASIMYGAQTTFELGPFGYQSSESGMPFDALATDAYWYNVGQMAINDLSLYQSVPSHLYTL